ncbi:MAG: hypothetical protein JWM81_635 [Candidatus Saccharibacteria bacterium]|nr:hypothetical protein [Candidatus Saccharibacteria bacterium]
MTQKYKKQLVAIFALITLIASVGVGAASASALSPVAVPISTVAATATPEKLPCGAGAVPKSYMPVINIGCKNKGNPIVDALFAIIRFLSYGVGLIIVGSLIVAGIQYTTARDDPQAVAAAQKRIKSTIGALALFIFGFTILNYVIPAGVLK